MKSARSILATFLLGPSLIFSAAASADVTVANYVSDNAFNYQISHMPDLDQKRQGLDNDGGCHCVPAAVMNLLAYAANHGFGDIPPSPHSWQSNQNHVLGTTVIDIMGQMMGTTWNPVPNPDVCGTNGDDANAALANWLNP